MAEAISKAQAIRDYVAQNENATAEQVVKGLAEKGIPVSVQRVYDVKSKSKPKRKRAAKAARESATVESPQRTPSKPGPGSKLWTFPKNSLEDAIKIPKAIEEKNAGNPMKADVLAKAVGFRQPTDWRFLDLLRSANQYGLVSGSGASATVSLAEIGQDVVAPSSPTQRQQALLKAFRNVDEFKRVEEFYKGKRIPEDEYFFNTLARDFSVPRDRAGRFAEVFRKNLDLLGQFNAPGVPSDGAVSQEAPPKPEAVERVLGLVHLDQTDVGLVNQGRGLERLPRLLLRQLLRRQPAQLLIDQRQELLSGMRLALLDGRQDACDLAHRYTARIGKPSEKDKRAQPTVSLGSNPDSRIFQWIQLLSIQSSAIPMLDFFAGPGAAERLPSWPRRNQRELPKGSLLTRVHFETAQSLTILGRVLEELEKFEVAWESRQEAHDLVKALFPETHREHWRVIDARLAIKHLGVLIKMTSEELNRYRALKKLDREIGIAWQKKNWKDGVNLARQLRDGTKALLGDSHRDYAASTQTLAVFLDFAEKPAEAEPLYREALTLRRRLLGKQHPLFADTCRDLVALLQKKAQQLAAQGKLTDTQLIREEVIGILTELYGPKDWRVTDARFAKDLTALMASWTEEERGRFQEIDRQYRRAGRLLAEMKDEEIVPLAKEIVKGVDALFAPGHRYRGNARNLLALSYQIQGNLNAAKQAFDDELKENRRGLGIHPDTATVLENLAGVESDLNLIPESYRHYQEAKQIFDQCEGKNSSRYWQFLNNYSIFLERLGELNASEEITQESLKVTETIATGAPSPRAALTASCGVGRGAAVGGFRARRAAIRAGCGHRERKGDSVDFES